MSIDPKNDPIKSAVVANELLLSTTDGVVLVDRQYTICYTNPAIEFIFGFGDKFILGTKLNTLVPNSFVKEVLKKRPSKLSPSTYGIPIKISCQREDGTYFPLEVTTKKLKIGRKMFWLLQLRDVTETQVIQESLWATQKELAHRVDFRTSELARTNNELNKHIAEHDHIQNKLYTSEERLKTVVKNAPVIMYSVDMHGVITLCEGKGLQRLDKKPHEIVGRSVFDLFKDIPNFKRDFNKVLAGKEINPILKINNTIFECHYSLTRDKKNRVIGVIGVATDITDRKRIEDKLVKVTHYDSLTNLPNRDLFRDRLSHAVAKANRYKSKVALIYMDLDRFKLINDSLGHVAGDELLKSVAQRLRSNARAEDTIARLGGDEFTVILEDCDDLDNVTKVARKTLDIMSKPFDLSGHKVYVTGSIGITVYPLDGDNIEDLLRNADTAMYRAKDKGGNNYQFYTADMNAKAVEHLIMESNLRQALVRKEFILHYQPQINLQNQQIIGVEALLRWNHPKLGLIYPKQFMALAEETGLIVSIGEWVLRSACKQACKWQQKGMRPMRIAVNLSARQFRQPNLVKIIKSILNESGLKPKYLELEITESFLLDDAEGAIATLKELSRLGIQISMDDFGTGYSSLSYLKRFPLHGLKIDKSFIRDISNDPGDAAIAEAIVALGQSLQLRVIAEGVETKDQLSFLKTRGCDHVQGFLLSHPIPAELIPHWCETTNTNLFKIDKNILN